MPVIKLITIINAPKERCFDLSMSIDLHKIPTIHTNEEAIAGVTSGLIGLNESVTWRAKHFGMIQKLTTGVTAFDSPNLFVDEMETGAFKYFKHEHHFEEFEGGTKMTDYFDYEYPYGLIGRIIDFIVLEKYMTNLLIKRNQIIKEFGESERWKEVLGS